MSEVKKITTREETVGKAVVDNWDKEPDSNNPQEIIKASMVKAEEAYHKAIMEGKKLYPDRPFFIVALSREFKKLLTKTMMNQFLPRQTCPTPNYDQHVWRYDPRSGEVEYIWSIPSRDTCHYLKDNALRVAPEERQLLQFVMEYADGTLYKKCKKLNNEKEKSNELERKSNG